MPEHELTPECRSIIRQSAALAGLGAFVVDLGSGRCLYCSEQLARLHGLAGERGAALIGGAAQLERIHPDDRERYRAALAAARGEAGRYEVDYRMHDAAGALVRLRETGERVAQRSGARLVGCVRPLGEAERSEAMAEARLAERTAELRRARDAAEAARQAAIESNKLFVAAAESLMDGLAILDAEDRLVYYNRRYPHHAPRLFGEALEIGRRFSEIVEAAVAAGAVYHPDMGEDFVARRLSWRRAPSHEDEFRLADGRWVRVRETSIEGGGRVLLTSDVTAQRAATSALEEREHRLRTIADGVPVPIIIVRVSQPEILFVNELAAETFGFRVGPQAEALRAAYVDPKDRRRLVERLQKDGRVDGFEVQLRRVDGSTMWALLSARAIRVAGEPALLLTATDISERMASATELEEREERFRAVAEGVPLAVTIARSEPAEILFANARAAENFGLRAGDGADAIRAAYVRLDDRKALVAQLERTGRVDGFELQMRRADGSTMWALLSARPITFHGEPAMLSAVTEISELKAMEQALRDSEARLAAFMENAPVGMYLKDLDGHYVLANPEMTKVFARPAHEMIGRTAADTRAEHDLVGVARRDREVLESGRVVVVEEHTPDLDAYRWSMVIRFPIRAGDGSISQIGGFHVDITPQKRAEAELRASEARLSAFMSHAPIGMFVKGLDGRYVMANPEMGRVMGCAAAEALGRTAAEVFPRDTAARIAKYDRELLRTGAPRVHEHHLAERETYAWIMSIRFPIRDQTGAITHIGGFAVDITERKAMEEALKASEQQFRVLAEAHPVPLFIVRLADGRIMVATPPCEPLLKVPLAELIGDSLLRFCADPETSAKVEERIEQEGALNGLEVRLRRADGSEFWGSLTSRLLTFEGERAMVAAIVDLSESKRIEAELDRQTALLHQNEKLSALGSLLAGVAHELNNPLSLVVGYAGLLEEMAPDDATRERAIKVRIAADRCARIVRTFLAMARNKPRAAGAVQLNAVVEAALEIVAYGLRTADIEVERTLPPDLPPVHGDPDQLHQVLANLLVNAQQALQTVPPPRRLRTATGSDGEAVWVAVSDNGPGIPAGILNRIFDPFFTTKPQGVGTGVGLSVSHGIVAAHGGQILVESRPGEGSTFTVRLPRARAARAEQADAAPPAAHRRARILVVDDEPEIARLLTDILEGDGHETAAASSGREALDWLSGREVDLIISDLRMPDMDGPALYRALAERRPELLTRLVFITGDTLAADITGFLSETGANVLEKPLDPPDVSRRVQVLLADYEALSAALR
ncbi:MAG TPA: PAS domain S-box protein [Geminicoccaceae bacterium]|nr:PAS domain S-box protein [Geminicoccaceae bacterium]